METSASLLRQEFEKRKGSNPNFSLRSFARWLNVSPAQLSQMMSGKRPVTFSTMRKICDRLGLSPSEWSDIALSILAEKKITTSNDFKFKTLEEDKFKLIADWYHLAILSLTKTKGASGDTRWIARRLGITSETASDAVRRLVRLNLLQLKPEFKQIGDPFEVSSEVPSPTIRRYHQQMMQIMSEKIETVPNHLREFQSITQSATFKCSFIQRWIGR